MSLSEIESFMFGGPCAHFVTAFRASESEVTIEFKPMACAREDGAITVIATFADAIIFSAEQDQDENLGR